MRRTKTLLYIFLLAIISVFLIMKISQEKPKENKVCFKNYCFYVELAKNQEERAKGLMFRESLDLNRGMLFVFEEDGKHSFWMKNTFIALDIIWINKDKKVVFISKNVQPCLEENCEGIEPDEKARYVLEVNAGMVDKINIKIGDRVIFE